MKDPAARAVELSVEPRFANRQSPMATGDPVSSFNRSCPAKSVPPAKLVAHEKVKVDRIIGSAIGMADGSFVFIMSVEFKPFRGLSLLLTTEKMSGTLHIKPSGAVVQADTSNQQDKLESDCDFAGGAVWEFLASKSPGFQLNLRCMSAS